MTHEGFPSLISLDLSHQLHSDNSVLRRWLAGSLVLHIVIALLALNMRFSPTIERPLTSYEVSLVTLPTSPTSKAVTRPTSKARTPSKKPRPAQRTAKPKSKPVPKSRKAQAKPVPPPAKPQEKALAPLSTNMPSERLSESLSSAAKSVAVPKKLSPQAPVKPLPAIKTSPGRPTALENIKLPSETPSLASVKPLAPAEPVKPPEMAPEKPPEPSPAPTTLSGKTAPSSKLKVEDALKGIKTPPKSPTLASVQPFTKTQEDETPSSTHELLSQSLREKIQSVQIPSPSPKRALKTKKRPKTKIPITSPPIPAVPQAPELAKATPQKKAEPQSVEPRERLSDSLKQVLDSVKVPQLRDVSKTDPVPPFPSERSSPTENTANSEPTIPQNFRTEIDQQLAKLKIPDVVPIESIRTRLQVQETTSEDAASNQPGSISQSSRNSKGQNRYLALVQAQIDQQWVAPQVEAHEKNLQVALNFRILPSGKVIDLDVERGSGNRYFDSAALRAVQGADPLPRFTSEISGSSLNVTITFKVEKDAP